MLTDAAKHSPDAVLVPAERPANEAEHTFIRESFIECPNCRARPGSPTLCTECLERRELWYLAEKHKLLPHQYKKRI